GESITGRLTPWPRSAAVGLPPLLEKATALLYEPIVRGEKITAILVVLRDGTSKLKLAAELDEGSRSANGPGVTDAVAVRRLPPELLMTKELWAVRLVKTEPKIIVAGLSTS